MWHPVSWTPRALWSPKHLKLVTVYVLVLLVSLSFASGQSRPFKHQIDNRSSSAFVSLISVPGAYSRNGSWTVGPSGLQLRQDSLKVTVQGATMASLYVGSLVTSSRAWAGFKACCTLLNLMGPEIDPFWYVGRGVRPIGRFGKRQLRSSHGSLRPVSRRLDFILNALWEQKVSGTEDSDW